MPPHQINRLKKSLALMLTMIVGVFLINIAAMGCSARQTEEGRAPSVEVSGGELPEYEVDTPDPEVEVEASASVDADAEADAD